MATTASSQPATLSPSVSPRLPPKFGSQAIWSIRAYFAGYCICLLALIHPNSDVPTPQSAPEHVNLVLHTGMGFLGIGASLVIFAFSGYKRGWSLDLKQTSLRCMLVVCFALLTTHWQMSAYQTVRVPIFRFDGTYIATFVPLEQVGRLVMQGVTFGLFCTLFHCGRWLSWVIHITLVLFHSFVIAAFSVTVGTYLFFFLCSAVLLLLLINFFVLFRLRSVALVAMQHAASRPARFVATWMVPAFMLLLLTSLALRVALLKSGLYAFSYEIGATCVDATFLVLIGTICSDVLWQDEREMQIVIQEEKEKVNHAENELAAHRVFLRYICHEMRVPLNGIVLASEEMLDERSLSARFKEDLSTIVLSAAAMSKLLDDFLTLARIEAGMMRYECASYSPKELAADAVSTMRAQWSAKKLDCRLEVDEDVPAVAEGDAGRLRQVLCNFLSNAIKFTPASGTVRVHVTFEKEMLDAAVLLSQSETLLSAESVTGDANRTQLLSSIPSGSNKRSLSSQVHRSDSGHPTKRSNSAQHSNALGQIKEDAGVSAPRSSRLIDSAQAYVTSDEGAGTPVAELPGLIVLPEHPSPSHKLPISSTEQKKVTLLPLKASLSIVRASSSKGGKHKLSGDAAVHVSDRSDLQEITSGYLRFAVTDNGCGMSKEDVELLFQPFQQIRAGAMQKGNGTGLGLAICKHIIEASRGQIGCVSREGVGSTFWFTVPLVIHVAAPSSDVDRSHGSAPAMAPQPAMSTLNDCVQVQASVTFPSACDACALSIDKSGNRTISPAPQAVGRMIALVVDDTASNRKLLARKLLRLGFGAVLEAEDGIDLLERWPDMFPDSSKPSIMFIDRNMPRMGGETLVKILRENKGMTCPIIGVTGDALEEDRTSFLACGLNDIIVKPCTNEKLQKVLGDNAAIVAQASLESCRQDLSD